MNLISEPHDQALVIRVGEPRIDAVVAIRFKDAMREMIRADTPDRVILDLSAVGFIDSSGLGALVSVMKILAPDRRMELAAVSPNVDRVLRLTRMNSVMTIHLTLDDALGGPTGLRAAG